MQKRSPAGVTLRGSFQRLNKSPFQSDSLARRNSANLLRAKLAEEVSTDSSLASSMFLDLSQKKRFGPNSDAGCEPRVREASGLARRLPGRQIITDGALPSSQRS